MIKYRALAHAAVVFFSVHASAALSQQVDKIGIYNLDSQRLTGAESVVVKDSSIFSSLSVLVTVGIDGRVIDAEVADSSLTPGDPAPGLAAAKQWTFRPQTFDGHPVQVVGSISIKYAAPEIPADPTVPFPVAPLGDVEIVLERSACYGTCPDYRVSISGDGRVRFSPRDSGFPRTAAEVHRAFSGLNVLWPGTHEAHVSPQAVAHWSASFANSISWD